jgi:putative transposase
MALGGTANHIHILMTLPPKQSLSAAVRDLKANSSRWMSETGLGFAWQSGFGAFSVSPSQAVVKNYIRNQAEHHKRRNFEEEFLLLLKKAGIEYDPKFVFG